jgi:hypothetical protein
MKGILFCSILLLTILSTIWGCQPSVTHVYSPTELKYLLIDEIGEPFYCDPYQYPISREGQEEQDAIAQFESIRGNQEMFSVMLIELDIPEKADYSTAEKIQIFREYNRLNRAITMTAPDTIYDFSLRIQENEGKLIEGTITREGKIRVTKRETSFNTCPICLSAGTLIDTPTGQVPIEQLAVAMKIWTADRDGRRVVGEVVETGSATVPGSFQLLRITLDDGCSVTASPGHPGADGRLLAEYRIGDELDSKEIVLIEYVDYLSASTYDILPSGQTGLYWANGTLLGSTLKK